MCERRGNVALLALLLAMCLLVPALLGLCACGDAGTSPFESEINALYAYRRSLEAEYSNIVGTFREEYLVPVSANVTLVYLDLSEQLWDAYGVLKESSLAVRTAAGAASGSAEEPTDDSPMLHVTLCLSEDMLPGDDGCITMEQLDVMLSEGASLALYYKVEEGEKGSVSLLAEYIDRMSVGLAERGIAMPNAIVFSNGSYEPELQEQYNELLVDRGIPIVLHYGEGSALEIIEAGNNSEIFRPGIVNWQTPQMQKFFVRDIMALGGCAAYAFSFTDANSEVYLDLSNDAYRRMLVYISEFVLSGQLNSRPFGEAWDKLIDYHTSAASLADAIDDEKERLRAEIRYVDGLIGRLSAVKNAEDAENGLLREVYSIRLSMLESELSEKLHGAYESLGFADRASVGLLFDSICDGAYDIITDLLAFSEGDPAVGITLCFGADSLPGDEGCMTAEELRELTALGCGTAIYFDGEGTAALDTELAEIGAALAESGIEMPSTLVLADGSYNALSLDGAALSAILSEHGILGVAHSDAVTQVNADGSFTMPVISWNEDFCRRDRIRDAVKLDEALLFENIRWRHR